MSLAARVEDGQRVGNEGIQKWKPAPRRGLVRLAARVATDLGATADLASLRDLDE